MADISKRNMQHIQKLNSSENITELEIHVEAAKRVDYLTTSREEPMTMDYTQNAHPLAHLAGKYENEPLWDEFVAAMEAYREEQEAKEVENLPEE